MTQDEIIEMASKAGLAFDSDEYPEIWQTYMNVGKQELVAFANLVADKATEEANAKANASWTLMCKKMVALEREACAKVCDEVGEHPSLTPQHCAESIRARGEQALAQLKQDGDCKKCKDGCPACDARKLQKEAHDLL
ncbi:hypothetical protein UFOVP379_38 [uncultured Caudovirales phage]|uniref:Uncharacterized protein n=1 Tax=uncultured Caudovirales phage TaxID=2100421 RepID=A0A6J7X198_9CAUD|nr:hypothetical protein UFOVP379_38 [uncultured Caudovirales phage]